jgi:hypothetical protein
MASEIPPVTECSDPDPCATDPAAKCYTIKEAIPVCSSLNPASQLQSSDCTRLDNTYDKSLQSLVVPAVGGEMQISLCNAGLYTVGSWIEFVDGVGIGSVFQIVTVNSAEKYIRVRNSCSDGETAIIGNASPGATFAADSRFIVRGKADCKTEAELEEELESALASADNICFENIPDRLEGQEEIKLLGTVISSDCVEGEAQPCLRKALVRETKDGSLKLGNISETPEGDTTLKNVFVDVVNRLVIGDVPDDTKKWLFTAETTIASHNSDPGVEQSFACPAIPAGATHAIVQVHLYVDDNPAGNIMVNFGSLKPLRSLTSWGEAYTVANISVKIDSGNIKYLLSATDGGVMDFSGQTKVDLFLLGYEKITTIA